MSVIENPMEMAADDTEAATETEATEAELIAEFEKAAGIEEEGETPKAAPEKPAQVAVKAEPATPDSAPVTEEDETGLPSLERLMRSREREHQAKLAAKQSTHADEEKEQFRVQLAELQARLAERERKDQELAEREEKLNRAYGALKEDPLEFIKGVGWGADELVNRVARSGTPEWQAEQKLRAELAAANQKLSKVDLYIENQTKQQDAWAKQQEQYRVESIYREFLTEHVTPEKTPTARALAASVAKVAGSDIDAVLRTMADTISDKAYRLTGQRPSLSDIAERLEWQATSELAALRQEAAGGSITNGTAPKAPAATNGSRTIGTSKASERRAAPKAYEAMTPAEQRAEDIRIYNEAERLARQ